MFLCSFYQPGVLGEVLFRSSVFSGTVPSPPTLFMSLTPALRGETGHCCLKFCPCSQTHSLGEALGSGRAGGVSGPNYSFPGQGQPRNQHRPGRLFCSFPSAPPTPRYPCLFCLPSRLQATRGILTLAVWQACPFWHLNLRNHFSQSSL